MTDRRPIYQGKTVNLISPPSNGVYRDVPFHVYQSWNAINVSSLVLLEDSAATLRDYQVHGKEETDAQEFGTLTHCAILEPDQLRNRYMTAQPCSAMLKSKKDTQCPNRGLAMKDGSWLCGQHWPKGEPKPEPEGMTVVSAEELGWAMALTSRIAASKRAMAMLAKAEPEVSIVGEIGGLVCKGRVDLWMHGELGDVKTTLKTRAEFQPEIFRRRYHAQAWFYMTLAASIGNPCERFTIIAAHKRRPFLVSYHTMPVDSEAIRLGEEWCRPLLAQYGECLLTGEWPGYDDDPAEVVPPNWARTYEEEPFV